MDKNKDKYKHRYILKNKKPIFEPNFEAHIKFYSCFKNRIVKQDNIRIKEEEFTVSTVFLALNHNFSDHGNPILFETMIFFNTEINERIFSKNLAIINKLEDYQERYCTWEEAEQGHKKAISFLKKEIGSVQFRPQSPLSKIK